MFDMLRSSSAAIFAAFARKSSGSLINVALLSGLFCFAMCGSVL